MNIDFEKKDTSRIPLLNLGFRPFFLGAGFFAVLSLSLWAALFIFHYSLPISLITPTQWHAHEMLYGYSMAVVAGFLLTAVKNWTGVQTPHGMVLMVIFACWLIARLFFFAGTAYLLLAAVFDMAFSLLLLFFISLPVIKVKQWKQISVLSKIALLMIANLCFYLGAFQVIDHGIFWGIYGGLYLLLGLVLVMGRRVIPFFIEMGVGYNVTLLNAKWLDISSLMLFVAFFIAEIVVVHEASAAYFALALFLLNSIRMIGWYTWGIWKKSLLWSLYLSFWFIAFGFLLLAGRYFFNTSPFLAVHAFTVGGIGLLTMGMMARVSLGHTGREIANPPKAVAYALGLLLLSAILRVIIPLFNVVDYVTLIALSQALWILAFLLFVMIYHPILSKARIDGRFG